MKLITRLSAIILTLILTVSMCVMPASAAIPPQKYGDVYYSDSVDIMDVTAIQRYLAHIEDIEEKRHEAADVDADNIISIFDATMIQQYLAGSIAEFPAGKFFLIDHQLYHVYADYDSGKAIAGETVTFTVWGYAYPEPNTVKLYVNSELVGESTDGNNLTYTFEEAGTYKVTAEICDKWGVASSRTQEYVVIDKPEDTSNPMITALYRKDPFTTNVEVFANAKYGTEPYEYEFVLTVFGEVKLVQEYSENNVFSFDVFDILGSPIYGDPVGGYTVTAAVKDANGNIDTEVYNFDIEEMPLA